MYRYGIREGDRNRNRFRRSREIFPDFPRAPHIHTTDGVTLTRPYYPLNCLWTVYEVEGAATDPGYCDIYDAPDGICASEEVSSAE